MIVKTTLLLIALLYSALFVFGLFFLAPALSIKRRTLKPFRTMFRALGRYSREWSVDFRTA